MTFKRITHQLHLWLGLSSGLVVFIVSITGCLYAFKTEIEALTKPYLFVETKEKAVLPPSIFVKEANKIFPEKHLHAINYAGKGRSVEAIFYGIEPAYYDIIYFNPYTSEVLKVKDMDTDFFRIILVGHYYLWLPANIGQPIVASARLIFVILLFSGINIRNMCSGSATLIVRRVVWDCIRVLCCIEFQRERRQVLLRQRRTSVAGETIKFQREISYFYISSK